LLTQDPIGLAGGVNLYAYAGNNPVAYNDPFGLGPCDVALPCPPPSVLGGLLAGAARAVGTALSTIGAATLAVISTVLVTSDEGEREQKHVYHRRPTDPKEVLVVAATRELHGKAARNIYASDIPAVKAYQGPLPPGMPGYEFTTTVAPDPGSPGVHRLGGQVNWSGDRPGVRKVDDETVAIPVTITKVAAP